MKAHREFAKKLETLAQTQSKRTHQWWLSEIKALSKPWEEVISDYYEGILNGLLIGLFVGIIIVVVVTNGP